MVENDDYVEKSGFDLPYYMNADGSFIFQEEKEPKVVSDRNSPGRRNAGGRGSSRKVRPEQLSSAGDMLSYHVSLPEDIVRQSRTLCALQGISLASLIKSLLVEYCADNKDLIEKIDMYVKPFFADKPAAK